MMQQNRQSQDTGFASIAISGTFWATGQMILNKVATVVATLVIARQLSSDEVALACLAIMVVKFMTVLPPLIMGDVLVARGVDLDRLIRPATAIAFHAGVLVLLIVATLSPLVAQFYSGFPTIPLALLLITAALRPLGDGAQVGPATELRLSFRNRSIAVIEGSLQLFATIASVVMAVMGAGAWAMVAPLSAAALGKAVIYRVWRRCVLDPPLTSNEEDMRSKAARGVVCREFLSAAGAQYLHGVTDVLPVILLGKLASEASTGLYAFAFNLAGQANAVIAAQISGVLLPVLGRLNEDGNRQVSGYFRTIRSLGALTVPICMCQAVFGAALFNLCFETRWQPAASIFAVLSLCEAFFFATAPTMAMLKAQGKFRTFLAWQGSHLGVTLIAIPLAALSGGALGVAIANTTLWAISVPIATWLSTRHRGKTLWGALCMLLAPWTTTLPIGIIAWLIEQQLLSYGWVGALAALLIVAPLCLFLMLWATKWGQPDVFEDFTAIYRRLRPLRAPIG
jgi:O-antigen/teichoic acid export membrane protein